LPKLITIALAGNPNSGKTTLFNALTGSHQHVGNWPGVTVEKKEGTCRWGDLNIKVVDLPGVYSLTAYSPDEIVARNFIIGQSPDLVINIVDGTNLERNLYLTLQLLETGVPCVVALNMMDEVEKSGYHIDIAALSRHLEAPVIPVIASREQGIRELLEAVVQRSASRSSTNFRLNYGEEVETEIAKLEAFIAASDTPIQSNLRWTAVKLLENDAEVLSLFQQAVPQNSVVLQAQAQSLKHLRGIYREAAETLVADARYGLIAGLMKDILKKPPIERVNLSDRIDRIMVNRWLGIPLFLLIMLGMFQFIFTLSPPLMNGLDYIFQWVGGLVSHIQPAWLNSLLVDGILGGVGTVLLFVPPVFLLFIMISILEDSGYMSRAAFVMDKLMHHLGLHGRSFIPMVIGFGCTIPAIMACRTIENPKDRLATMLIVPFMSCGGRLPIYILLATAFFPGSQGLVVFSLYLLGIIIGLLAALVLRKKVFQGESSHYVMELPPYRFPTIKGIAVHTWQRGKSFLQRATTVILAAVVVVWLLGSLPWGVEYASAESWMGQLGQIVAPIFSPAGFGQWQAAVSLIFGILAKEVVVGTLGTLFGVDSIALGANLTTQLGWTPLVAYAFMVFCLLYLPCAATLATLRAESGGWKWAAFAAVYTTVLAWIAATLIFQVGSLFTG
jgi:ferrous iron transport protein B